MDCGSAKGDVTMSMFAARFRDDKLLDNLHASRRGPPVLSSHLSIPFSFQLKGALAWAATITMPPTWTSSIVEAFRISGRPLRSLR